VSTEKLFDDYLFLSICFPFKSHFPHLHLVMISENIGSTIISLANINIMDSVKHRCQCMKSINSLRSQMTVGWKVCFRNPPLQASGLNTKLEYPEIAAKAVKCFLHWLPLKQSYGADWTFATQDTLSPSSLGSYYCRETRLRL